MSSSARHHIFSEYLQYLGQKGVADSTLARNQQFLTRWERWLDSEGVDPAAVPAARAHEYFGDVLRQSPNGRTRGDGTALARSTRRQHLVSVKAAYSYALDVDLIEGKNPCRRISIPATALHERHFLSPSDIRAALAACRSRRELLLVSTFSLTGLRLHEVASLRWTPAMIRNRHGETVEGSWIDVGSRRIRVLGKGEKPRVVPIHSWLLPKLRGAAARAQGDHLFASNRGGGLTAWSVSYNLAQILDRAAVKRVGARAHAFRRAFNDSLRVIGRGYDLERRAVMGHSGSADINLSLYARPSFDRLAELVELAYADDPLF